jgi:tripeptidyl-peptidase-1
MILDFGVGGNAQPSCNNGFYAIFPASCPYITSVGATQFSNGVEVAALFENGGSTGGGFSNYFRTPLYQSGDVASYLSQLDPIYSNYYDGEGRGYPDVSLLGEYYGIILNGTYTRVYGTSTSTPAWASLISLINDYRIGEGKPTLGFLNPLLYAGAARYAMKDITSGFNRGCNAIGFGATAGWDPLTGLGSVNFSLLRSLLI